MTGIYYFLYFFVFLSVFFSTIGGLTAVTACFTLRPELMTTLPRHNIYYSSSKL